MTKYILYYDRNKIVDLTKFRKTYSHETQILGVHEPLMTKGTPILVNVDGSYIKMSDVQGLTYKSLKNHKPYDGWHWLRDNNGRVICKR
jgi:hypothetical protein